MPHQKQHLQKRVWRADPICHPPWSLTDSCPSQHGACSPADGAAWICWSSRKPWPPTPPVQFWPGLQWQQLSQGSASQGQPPHTLTETEGPLHWYYFHSPSPASPRNLGKKLPSRWGRVMGVGECWLSQSVFMNQQGNQMRHFWSFQEPEMQNSKLDFIPILNIKVGIAQSYWEGLQWWKTVFKISFLQNEHFSLSVFCHPANCSPPGYKPHNELLSPNLMARFTLEGSLI